MICFLGAFLNRWVNAKKGRRSKRKAFLIGVVSRWAEHCAWLWTALNCTHYPNPTHIPWIRGLGCADFNRPGVYTRWVLCVREAPFNLSPPLCGHCPNSNYTPPRTQTGTLGHFFQAQFYHFSPFLPLFTLFTIFSLNKCPKPSGQGFRPPKIKQMPIWTWKILL